MSDRFEDRLRRRLSRLDAAVPENPRLVRDSPASRRPTGRPMAARSTNLPLGAAVGLAAVVLVLAVAGSALGPNGAGTTPAPTIAGASSDATASLRPSETGILVGNAQALPLQGAGNPVIVVATITNDTGRDVKLVGASSPVATRAGLYGTGGCACTGSPGSSGGAGLFDVPMPWWLIRAGETIQLRSGSGKIVLDGLARPLEVGGTVEVTLIFDGAPSVTVEVPIVAGLAEG